MNVRKLAVDAIDKIMINNAYSNIVVNDVLNKYELSNEDRGLFTNLVYGTLQHLLTIEYYIEPFIAKKKPKHWVRYLLYMSVYQLVYLKSAEYAVVNEATSIARLKDKQIASLTNEIEYLRAIRKTDENNKSIHNFIQGKIKNNKLNNDIEKDEEMIILEKMREQKANE